MRDLRLPRETCAGTSGETWAGTRKKTWARTTRKTCPGCEWCGESRGDLELLLSPSSDSAGWWECPWQTVPWMVTLWGSLNSCMLPRVNSLIVLWLPEINPCKEPCVEKNELNEINMVDTVIFSCWIQYFSFSYMFSFKLFLQLWSSQLLPLNLSTPKYLLHIFLLCDSLHLFLMGSN